MQKEMKRIWYTVVLGISSFSFAQDWKTDDQYIQNFAKYAVEEMELYKIPASIKLAQGILETGGGQSRLAREGKNHFGIKCKENWTGRTMKHTDDAPNECFRVYDDPRESYRDHSLFLANRKYYVGLFKLDMKDYRAWAYGLKKAGYATNPRYAEILISRIEKYKLYEFDDLKSHEVADKLSQRYPGFFSDDLIVKAKPKETPVIETPKTQLPVVEKPVEKILTAQEILDALVVRQHPNGGLDYVVLGGSINLDALSKKYNISEKRLVKYNDLFSSKLKKNQIIFLQPKKTYGIQETYTAQKDDTMHEISQKFGIKLIRLYQKNRMSEGEQPTAGQLIYLKFKRPR